MIRVRIGRIATLGLAVVTGFAGAGAAFGQEAGGVRLVYRSDRIAGPEAYGPSDRLPNVVAFPAYAAAPGDRRRGAKVSYALTDRVEVFVDLQKTKGQRAHEADGAGRDWIAFQDRNRRAYAIGISRRW